MNVINIFTLGLIKEDKQEHMLEYEFNEFDCIDFMEIVVPAFDEVCDNVKRDLGFVVGLNYKKFPEKSFMSYLTVDSIKYSRKDILEVTLNRLIKSIMDEIEKMDKGEKND